MTELAEPWDAVVRTELVKRKLSETKLQGNCAKWARSHGWWARKFSSPANRSVPDYLFAKVCGPDVFPTNKKVAIEFKIWPNVSTEKQWDEQYSMWLAGWQVEECNNFAHFKRIILDLEEHAG